MELAPNTIFSPSDRISDSSTISSGSLQVTHGSTSSEGIDTFRSSSRWVVDQKYRSRMTVVPPRRSPKGTTVPKPARLVTRTAGTMFEEAPSVVDAGLRLPIWWRTSALMDFCPSLLPDQDTR